MDSSRDGDLRALYARMNSVSLPLGERKKAYRSFDMIQKQLKDRRLSDMRWQLIGAVRANDTDIAEKISKRIEDYAYRKGLM